MASEEPMPRIVLISLSQILSSAVDKMYASFLSQLVSKATIQQVKEEKAALRLLREDPRPSAVLITDEALARDMLAHVWDAVLQYVRRGGTAVIMGTFPHFTSPSILEPFFAKAGLKWASNGLQKPTLVLNQEAVGSDLAATLLPQYSQKAVSLKNVATSDAWYRPAEGSVTESPDSPPTSANNTTETPVAFTKVGDGHLGYVGDMILLNEVSSDAVVFAMCGLSK
ncbi:hypothetical protein F5Y10DRAFT_267347 [Nemania abortiva]|nr:hypothetical protein F5Y10DRAFT_267347 [Nemania abortiva]